MLRFKLPAVSAARACLVTLVLAFASFGISAGEAAVDEDAKQILKKSTDYLSGLQEFGLVGDTALEAVMDTGQKVQFLNGVAMAVKRPDRFYAARMGDLVDQEFFYDGASLTLHDADSGFFASVEAPDTLEGALDFARDSLDIVAPGGDFIYSNAYELLMEDVESGFLVGPSVVGGVVCDHLAFSKPGTDFQVWVARGEQPLPLKVVITSRDVKNAPQFTVTIREWDVVTNAPDEKFAFDKPDDAQQIDFIVLDPAGN